MNQIEYCLPWISSHKVIILIELAVVGLIIFLGCMPKCRKWMNEHKIIMVLGFSGVLAIAYFLLFIWPFQCEIDANIRISVFVLTISAAPSLYFWVIYDRRAVFWTVSSQDRQAALNRAKQNDGGKT